MAHSSLQIILDDVAMVLDKEAEVLIVKMWRLLTYETEENWSCEIKLFIHLEKNTNALLYMHVHAHLNLRHVSPLQCK